MAAVTVVVAVLGSAQPAPLADVATGDPAGRLIAVSLVELVAVVRPV
jgi:hypothetical protein